MDRASFEIDCDFLESENTRHASTSKSNYLKDSDLDQYASLCMPQSTISKYKWAFSMFERWRDERNTLPDKSLHVRHIMEDISEGELSNILAKFIAEIKPARSETPYTGEIFTEVQ